MYHSIKGIILKLIYKKRIPNYDATKKNDAEKLLLTEKTFTYQWPRQILIYF